MASVGLIARGREQDINIDRGLPDANYTVLVPNLVWGCFKAADLSLAGGPRSVVFAALAAGRAGDQWMDYVMCRDAQERFSLVGAP